MSNNPGHAYISKEHDQRRSDVTGMGTTRKTTSDISVRFPEEGWISMKEILLAGLAAFSSVLFQDDFNDGNADGWYTVGPSDYEVTQGRYHFSGGGAVNDATSYRADQGESMSTPDYSMSADVSIDIGTFGGMMVRYSEDGEYNLLLVLGLPQQSLNLYRWYWSSIELLDSHAMPVTAGTDYRIRFQCQGDSFTGKAWETSDPEPDQWLVTAQDTVSRGGSAALFAAGVFKGVQDVYLSCFFDNVMVETSAPWHLEPISWAGIKYCLRLR